MNQYPKFIGWMLLLVLAASGCKKDQSITSVDLMEGAIAYSGSHPDVVTVQYLDNGRTVKVNAEDDQYVVFFKTGTAASTIQDLLQANACTVLAQIPQIEYYLLKQTAVPPAAFISTFQNLPQVEYIAPDVPGYPKSGALVLDDCLSGDHGDSVQATLRSCGGLVRECSDITFTKNGIVYGSHSLISKGMVAEANDNQSRPTYINLSFNGGLARNTDYDFETLSPNEQEIYERNFYVFMTNVLMSVAAIQAEYRQNLVVTISAGNENYELSGMLEYFRERPRLLEVLRDNVLLVSTERIPGIHANYAYGDPDVVVLNNTEASRGSSLAAPCALGMIQDLVAETGASVKDVVKAVKAASWILPDREVDRDNVLALLRSVRYATQAQTLLGFAHDADCIWRIEYDFDNILVYWDGSNGIIEMPVLLYWGLTVNPTNHCNLPLEPSARTMMRGVLTGTDASITSALPIFGRFRFTQDGQSTENIPQFFSLRFNGSKQSNGTITGVLSSAGEVPGLMFPETLPLTLSR